MLKIIDFIEKYLNSDTATQFKQNVSEKIKLIIELKELDENTCLSKKQINWIDSILVSFGISLQSRGFFSDFR